MSSDNPLVLLNTYLGSIAISLNEVRAARYKAEELLGRQDDRSNYYSETKPLLNAEQIAKLFEMDATWFLTRARENRIPHIRLGKYVRFDRDEIRHHFLRKGDRHAN